MLFEMRQYDIKVCHYNMEVFAVYTVVIFGETDGETILDSSLLHNETHW